MAATVIKAVGMSMIERLAMTITELAMVPMAAAMMPSTKGSEPGSTLYGQIRA